MTIDQKRTITREKMEEIQHAAGVLCAYCEVEECEGCIVTNLVDSAITECPDFGIYHRD